MAYSPRTLIVHGGIGVITAVLIIAAIYSPVILPLFQAEARIGTLIVKVTDAPVNDLESLNLTINKVEILNKTGYWINLPIESGEAYFDLLSLENVTMDLAVGPLPVGNYTKIRMQIVKANATQTDGDSFTLNVPSDHLEIRVTFEVKANKTTNLIIEIIIDNKKLIAERGQSGNPPNLKPQFKAIVSPPI